MKKYFSVTETALCEIKKNVFAGKGVEAKKIISMVENYVSDSHHFEKNGDYVDAFGALNYAHGWIDCGVRLGIFDVKDNKLFTVR